MSHRRAPPDNPCAKVRILWIKRKPAIIWIFTFQEQEVSFKCLSENHYDKDKCEIVFTNYTNCQKFWVSGLNISSCMNGDRKSVNKVCNSSLIITRIETQIKLMFWRLLLSMTSQFDNKIRWLNSEELGIKSKENKTGEIKIFSFHSWNCNKLQNWRQCW